MTRLQVISVLCSLSVTAAAAATAISISPAGAHTRVVHEHSEPGMPLPDLPQPPADEDPAVLQALDFTTMDAHVEGRMVAVSGSAMVLDRVPGNLYIWLLRVHTNGKNSRLLTEHHYLEHVTTPLLGERSSLGFTEVIDLRPGTYKVELTIYAVPPDFPFKQVKFGEDLRSKAIVKLTRFGRVVVE